MEAPVLACSVRGCGLPLMRQQGTFVCTRGHSYDVARSGYLNLLQPQDRRSADAGDAADAVDARTRLIDGGVGRLQLDAIVQRAATLDIGDGAAVVDLGSGGGHALGELAAQRSIAGIGIDLSTAATAAAARRWPRVTWVVANADRRLPILDNSLALVLSINGRRNAHECARVLQRPGYLIVAVPAEDDLIELREAVQGERRERSRVDALADEHHASFALLERTSVREQRHLEREQLVDLLRGTYRGRRNSAAARIETLSTLEVTLATEVCLFAPR